MTNILLSAEAHVGLYQLGLRGQWSRTVDRGQARPPGPLRGRCSQLPRARSLSTDDGLTTGITQGQRSGQEPAHKLMVTVVAARGLCALMQLEILVPRPCGFGRCLGRGGNQVGRVCGSWRNRMGRLAYFVSRMDSLPREPPVPQEPTMFLSFFFPWHLRTSLLSWQFSAPPAIISPYCFLSLCTAVI